MEVRQDEVTSSVTYPHTVVDDIPGHVDDFAIRDGPDELTDELVAGACLGGRRHAESPPPCLVVRNLKWGHAGSLVIPNRRMLAPPAADDRRFDAQLALGRHHVGMPFVTGGLLQEWGPPRQALLTVQREIRDFNGRADDDDYCVDLAMLTWHNFREPDEPPGVAPGPVGRTQRRFVVWHSVPKGLATPEQVRAWLVTVLPDTERLVREHLPTKSRVFPADQLADEVVSLRRHLAHL